MSYIFNVFINKIYINFVISWDESAGCKKMVVYMKL